MDFTIRTSTYPNAARWRFGQLGVLTCWRDTAGADR
jgi:hypothetical protein